MNRAIDKIVKGEFAENAIRKDFVATEMHAIREAVSKVMQAEAKARQAAGKGADGSGGRGKKKNPTAKDGKVSKKRAPTSAQQTAAFAGTSEATMRKIAAVMKAAKENPEKYGDLVEAMDAGNVNAAYRALKRIDEMIAAQKKTVGLAKGTRGQLAGKSSSGGLKKNPPDKSRATLAEAGIDKNLAHAAVEGNLSLAIDLVGANPTSTSDIDTAASTSHFDAAVLEPAT